jgi:hypothetical protein
MVEMAVLVVVVEEEAVLCLVHLRLIERGRVEMVVEEKLEFILGKFFIKNGSK